MAILVRLKQVRVGGVFLEPAPRTPPSPPPPPLIFVRSIFVRSRQAYYISANNKDNNSKISGYDSCDLSSLAYISANNEDIGTKLSGYDPCDLSSTNKNWLSFGWMGMIPIGSFFFV